MEVIVLGSGNVGLTSAWYLSQAGHSVTVVDRQPRSAEETSLQTLANLIWHIHLHSAPGILKKRLNGYLKTRAFKSEATA